MSLLRIGSLGPSSLVSAGGFLGGWLGAGFGPAPSAPSGLIVTIAEASLAVGDTATANVSVSGTPAPTLAYQWTLDGVDIGGATGATYVTTAAGALRVRVTATNSEGVAGPVTSAPVTALVAPGAFSAGDWTLADGFAADGDELVLMVVALPTGAITGLEYRVNGGAAVALINTGVGGRRITVPALTLASVELRAVNEAGASAWSAPKTATPTAGSANSFSMFSQTPYLRATGPLTAGDAWSGAGVDTAAALSSLFYGTLPTVTTADGAIWTPEADGGLTVDASALVLADGAETTSTLSVARSFPVANLFDVNGTGFVYTRGTSGTTVGITIDYTTGEIDIAAGATRNVSFLWYSTSGSGPYYLTRGDVIEIHADSTEANLVAGAGTIGFQIVGATTVAATGDGLAKSYAIGETVAYVGTVTPADPRDDGTLGYNIQMRIGAGFAAKIRLTAVARVATPEVVTAHVLGGALLTTGLSYAPVAARIVSNETGVATITDPDVVYRDSAWDTAAVVVCADYAEFETEYNSGTGAKILLLAFAGRYTGTGLATVVPGPRWVAGQWAPGQGVEITDILLRARGLKLIYEGIAVSPQAVTTSTDAFQMRGNKIVFRHCMFLHSTDEIGGTFAQNVGEAWSDLFMINCVFTEPADGGADHNRGSMIYPGGKITFIDCTWGGTGERVPAMQPDVDAVVLGNICMDFGRTAYDNERNRTPFGNPYRASTLGITPVSTLFSINLDQCSAFAGPYFFGKSGETEYVPADADRGWLITPEQEQPVTSAAAYGSGDPTHGTTYTIWQGTNFIEGAAGKAIPPAGPWHSIQSSPTRYCAEAPAPASMHSTLHAARGPRPANPSPREARVMAGISSYFTLAQASRPALYIAGNLPADIPSDAAPNSTGFASPAAPSSPLVAASNGRTNLENTLVDREIELGWQLRRNLRRHIAPRVGGVLQIGTADDAQAVVWDTTGVTPGAVLVLDVYETLGGAAERITLTA